MGLINIVSIQKFIQAFLGFVTVLIVSHKLDVVQQALYFSLNSVYSAYSIIDLGLSVLIIQVCAFWYFKEKNNSNLSNFFKSFLLKTKRWYKYLSLICFLIFPLGFIYFQSIIGFSHINWHLPLTLCVISMALYLISIPYISLLEGMNKIQEVYKIKILYYSLGTILSWLILFGPNPLYAVSMVPLTASCVTYFVVTKKYRSQFRDTYETGSTNTFSWRKNIFPLQKKELSL